MPPLHVILRRQLCPLRSPVSPLLQRCFSQQSILRAAPREQQPPRPPSQAQRSMRLVSKDMQQIPSDVGILDRTFIAPTGKNAISLFKSPSRFLKLQFKRFLLGFRDQFSLIVLKYSSPKEKGFLRRNLKLARSTVAPTAVALHRQMYSSFAEGDIASLRKICTDGIYDSFRARIVSRPRGQTVEWELMEYTKRAKIVSNRGARLPMEGAAIRQAVVRISSKQKLTRWSNKGGKSEVVPGSGKEKNVIEYVVIQKKYEAWKSGPWHVWGTTRETTLDDVEDWERRALE